MSQRCEESWLKTMNAKVKMRLESETYYESERGFTKENWLEKPGYFWREYAFAIQNPSPLLRVLCVSLRNSPFLTCRNFGNTFSASRLSSSPIDAGYVSVSSSVSPGARLFAVFKVPSLPFSKSYLFIKMCSHFISSMEPSKKLWSPIHVSSFLAPWLLGMKLRK